MRSALSQFRPLLVALTFVAVVGAAPAAGGDSASASDGLGLGWIDIVTNPVP